MTVPYKPLYPGLPQRQAEMKARWEAIRRKEEEQALEEELERIAQERGVTGPKATRELKEQERKRLRRNQLQRERRQRQWEIEHPKEAAEAKALLEAEHAEKRKSLAKLFGPNLPIVERDVAGAA